MTSVGDHFWCEDDVLVSTLDEVVVVVVLHIEEPKCPDVSSGGSPGDTG